MNKEIIKKNFSKYARYYDRYSTIQNICASRLISKIERKGFDRILDIGCGTGNFTRYLKEKFPGAHIKAVDISEEMIERAKEKLPEGVDFITADGEAIDVNEKFDLISSNATFQWFDDLEAALLRYRDMLNEGGIISFSIFGPLTFCELNTSLKDLLDRDISINSCNFVEMNAVERIMERSFKNVEIDNGTYKEDHDSLRELLRKIKYSGTRGDRIDNNGFWTPKIMDNLERAYRERYGSIVATYQVFFCKGER